MTDNKKDAKDSPTAARSGADKEKVVVEGTVAADRDPIVRTPRDYAIANQTEGLDAGAGTRRPEHVTVDRRHIYNGRITDQDGNVWEIVGTQPGRETVLSRAAIIKDGGDPGLYDIPHDDKFVVTGPVGNAQHSPSGVLDRETGEVKTPDEVEEDEGGAALDEVEPVKSEPGERPKATPLGDGDGAKGGGKKAHPKAKSRK